MVGTMGFQAVRYLNGGGVPPPAGNHHPINAPYGVFRAKDGNLTIGATGEKRWPLLCRLLAAPEWLTDPRFASNGERYMHRLALKALIDEKLQARTVAEWEALFNEAGIPAGPVYALDSALEHPQVRHREMVVERPHPVLGTVSLLGLPVKLSETPGEVHRIPPSLGEHTDELLTEIGYTEEEIAGLRVQGII
jgi:crotonobetainyl-CoA:carnitine CoA-transferase CaiB-like acyl-CoA transferase